jgi:hypothetical protein
MILYLFCWLVPIFIVWKVGNILLKPDIDRKAIIRNYIQVLVDAEKLMTSQDKLVLLMKRMSDIDAKEIPLWQRDAFIKATNDKFKI